MPADLTRETTVALDDDDVAQDEEPPTPTSTGTTVRRPAATAPFPPASGPLLSRASTTASEQAPASRRLTSSTTFLSASAFEADDEYSDGDADFADGHYARLYRRGAHDHHIRSGTKTSSTSDGATRSRTDSGSTTAGTGDTMSPGGRRNGGIGGGGIDGEEEAALARPALAPRYHGEDVRPTSSKELAGWYMYAFAAETYVICAISSFIPILLETLARENGVLLSDRTTPCGESYDTTNGKEDGQCVIYVLGFEINTASFAMYTFSISVLLQALLVVSISVAADHGNYRKKLLLVFAWVGSFCVMAYIIVSRPLYLLGSLLAIVSNTSFGASFVLLNSFLPVLVRNHPLVREAAIQGSAVADETNGQPSLDGVAEDLSSSREALLGGREDDDEYDVDRDGAASSSNGRGRPNGHQPRRRLVRRPTSEQEMTSIELQLSTQISAKGIGIGYGAGLFLQILAICALLAMGSSTWSQRVVLFGVGTWWAVFTIPAAMWLRPRPGPPLPMLGRRRRGGQKKSSWWDWVPYVIYSWKQLWRTIRLARRLLDIVLFLGGWFLLSDAIATTSSTAILFAKTQLHMKPWALGLINVISTLAGVVGAFSWSYISRRYGLRPHQTILACIALFEIIPLYGLLGYLPFVRGWGVIGLQQAWEMYPLAALYGFVLGGLSGYCRSLYGELIPPGSEASFFSLYAITDKGSSIFGPAIVGAIIDASGEIRPAFWFLACLVGLPAPLIYFVDVDRGKHEGAKLAEVIEGFKVSRNGFDGEHAGASDGSEDDEAEGMLANQDR